MPTKCCWVIHGSLTSERKASTSPSSFINHSTLLLNRALKRQAPCLYMHFEVRALDRLRTRRRVGSTLSLSLSLSQKSLTHNIGSASALPIISSAHDGNARPPASGIPKDGLQCTEHLKYMGTIKFCGGTVVLNDLEEFGRFETDEKSISRAFLDKCQEAKCREKPWKVRA